MVLIKVAIAIYIAIGFIFLLVYLSEGGLGPGAPGGPPRKINQEKTKPMAIEMAMAILMDTILTETKKCTDPCTPGP